MYECTFKSIQKYDVITTGVISSCDLPKSVDISDLPERDMVVLNGPDLDPPVKRDVTYILDRPTSRAFRVAYGTKWVYHYLPSVDFIFYLDDDSFLNIPRLFQLLASVAGTEQDSIHRRIEYVASTSTTFVISNHHLRWNKMIE